MDNLITTQRLILRKWKNEDLIPFSEMCADADVMKFMPGLLTKEETRLMIGRIKDHFEKHGFGLYAVEKRDSGKFIGFTGFMIPSFEFYFTPCIEIAWRIKSAEWNMGYATEAAKACMEYGFNLLDFKKLYSFTSVHNLASIRIMQKTGMEYDGTFFHPSLPAGHFLSEHVIYKIERN